MILLRYNEVVTELNIFKNSKININSQKQIKSTRVSVDYNNEKDYFGQMSEKRFNLTRGKNFSVDKNISGNESIYKKSGMKKLNDLSTQVNFKVFGHSIISSDKEKI